MDHPLSSKIAELKNALAKIHFWSKKRRKARNLMVDTLNEVEGELTRIESEISSLKTAFASRKLYDQELFHKFYIEFENRFRGSEEETKKKLTFYVERLSEYKFDLDATRGLDLGCGRGEWLELLAEQGFKQIHGIDLNSEMIETCTRKSLSATQANVFDFLETSPEESFDIITGFHIIEHFEFGELLSFLRLIYSRLKPNGVAILETPNPRNLIVGGSTFHFDPTHKKPLPIELLNFTCQFIGFQVNRIHQRNEFPDLLVAADSLPQQSVLLKNMLNCGLDYSIEMVK